MLAVSYALLLVAAIWLIGRASISAWQYLMWRRHCRTENIRRGPDRFTIHCRKAAPVLVFLGDDLQADIRALFQLRAAGVICPRCSTHAVNMATAHWLADRPYQGSRSPAPNKDGATRRNAAP